MKVSANFAGKVPVVNDFLSTRATENYPTTSLNENCEAFEFQTDRNHYVDLRQTYVALKLKFVKGCGYKTFNSKGVQEEHKKKAKADPSMEEEEEAAGPVVTHVNKNLHSIFSIVEVYIINQHIYNPSSLYVHKSYFSNNFKADISEYKGVLQCEVYDYEKFPGEIVEALLSEPFFERRIKMLGRSGGHLLYGKLGVDFFLTSELSYPKMKFRLRLIRARHNFYMISDNPKVSLGIVDCSVYIRRIALKDEYHKKRMDMLAYTPVEYNYLETSAKAFIIPARQNHFNQENIFNKAPVCRISMNTNSAFSGSCTESPFWYQ